MANLLKLLLDHQSDLLEGNTTKFDEAIKDLDINLLELDTDQIESLFRNASLYSKLALKSSLYEAHLKGYNVLADRLSEYERLNNKFTFFKI